MGNCLTSLANASLKAENERLQAEVLRISAIVAARKRNVARECAPEDADAAALCEAAAAGDVAWLRRAASAKVDLSVGDYDKRTALHLAASEGHVAVLMYLLEELNLGASPQDRWGGTPLDDAIRSKSDEVVEFLLSKGARKGLTAMDHAQTDLCDAASKGDIGLLRELIERGHNASTGDYDRRTPLHLAASENHLDVVVFLVNEARVDHSPVDRWGNSPLDDALRSKHTETVAYLKDKGARSAKSPNLVRRGLAAPLQVAQSAHLAALPALLRRRPSKGEIARLPSSVDENSASSANDTQTGSEAAKQHHAPVATELPPHASSRMRRRRPSQPIITPISAGLLSETAVAFANRAVPPLAAGGDRSGDALALHKIGRLTKLSKGGFTNNWNERSFALLGSSLYYADRTRQLPKPGAHTKLFAQLNTNCTLRLLPNTALVGPTAVQNVFMLAWGLKGAVGASNGTDQAPPEQVLLLAAPSLVERDEWLQALDHARELPPCPPGRVAALVASGVVEQLGSEEDEDEGEEDELDAAFAGEAAPASACRAMTPLEVITDPVRWMELAGLAGGVNRM